MLHQHTLYSLLALIGLSRAYAVPSTYAIHETRDAPTPLSLYKRVDPELTLPMRIGLKQNEKALASAEAWLMDVSHPASTHYGKHWTQDEVIKAFQPSEDAVDAVSEWLKSHGITAVHSDNKAWLAFDISAEKAEKLLHTEYYEHELSSGRSLATCDQYHVPRYLQRHIDYITPGVKGSDVTARLKRFRREAAPLSSRKRSTRQPTDKPKAFNRARNVSSIAGCDQLITPACIQAAYNFVNPDVNAVVSSNNSLGIFETGNVYSQTDLDLFFNRYTKIPKGTHPVLNSIDGGIGPKPCASFNSCGESDLDFELAMPIIYPQTTTLYQTDDPYEASDSEGIFNTFLDAIDGSYCTYSAFNETGNAAIDPQYPDPHEGGYKGQLMCGTYKPTNVISISYGLDEKILPREYQLRQCNEYLKLSLQGVSVIVASGDYGVAGVGGQCERDEKVFVASQPNGCPWVTNVGATTIETSKSVHDEVAATFSMPDSKGSRGSGGGFSNLFTAPSYQATAISQYYKTSNVSYPFYYNGNYQNSTGIYNRNGRGIPDLSALGQNIATYDAGGPDTAFGTSASAPIVAALFNRIVEERITVGKGPLGFVNPTLYQHPEVLNDVVKGNNPGCGTNGFEAATGWDPVTGLGTPNYPKMLELFLSLP